MRPPTPDGQKGPGAIRGLASFEGRYPARIDLMPRRGAVHCLHAHRSPEARNRPNRKEMPGQYCGAFLRWRNASFPVSRPSKCVTSSCNRDRRPWFCRWRMPWSASPKGSFRSSRTGGRSRLKRTSSGPATRSLRAVIQCQQCDRNYADHRPNGLRPAEAAVLAGANQASHPPWKNSLSRSSAAMCR